MGSNIRMASRRSFLQAGALGVGGITLSDFFKLKAEGAVRSSAAGRSVILFWLSGGPGHMETWDPKPLAPAEYRGPFGAIETSVPGIQFGELMPEQARLAHHLAVVRTVNHGSGDHTKGNHWMLTGFEGPAFNSPDNRQQRRPAMGSVVARLRGANEAGMPPYAAVPHLRGGTDNLFHYAAYLGGGWNPFVVNSDPSDAKFSVRDLTLGKGLSLQRLSDRRSLMQSLDTFRASADRQMRDIDEHQQTAVDLLTSNRARDAFDVSRETEALRDRYGRHTFGQSALVARRLVEHGVSFVTVNCVPWDHHGSPGQYKTEEGARLLIPPLDRAIAALVEDLIDRGLYDQTLIVAMGEFGRTPRMNANAGRDHWGNTFSVLFGGGGLRMGQTIGRSSRRGEEVVERPVDPQDVAATIYHHLGIDAQAASFVDHSGRPLAVLDRGRPISELLG
ncbi:DUF1501 domain-containing protein [Candidatus Laterigemmans baculatus]|uniref:DUF1501 domain-containing protein n=1 Tax=Candidatus Laterigemmans baculatus TaxID=2770505 RepID=UPI0013D9D586|nr:DUF1501 domain-containing protein [Candidatus Laterigemmans baculatus]